MSRRRPSRTSIPGLTRRKGRAYYARTMPAEVGGDRVFRALGAAWGSEAAVARATALGVLWDRGDWPIIRRWVRGEVHITQLVRAVREGSFDRLRVLNVEGVLLGDAIPAHLERVAATQRERTFTNHRTVTNALIDHFGGDFAMDALTTAEAEAFLHAPRLGGEPWAPGTQAQYLAIAGQLWQWVIDREKDEAEAKGLSPTVRRNPWKRAKTKKVPARRPAVLEAEEIPELLAHPDVRDTPRETALAVGLYAGLRLAEMIHLRVTQDLELDGPAPRIRVQTRDGAHAWETKTDRSGRDVPIPEVLVDVLRRHIASGYAGARYLFRSSTRPDGPVSDVTLRRWIREGLEAAGLQYGREGEGLTPHSLRHTHATVLLSSGLSLATVAARIGDTKEVTLETYAHALPSQEELVLRVLAWVGDGAEKGESPHHPPEFTLPGNAYRIRGRRGATSPVKPVNDGKAAQYVEPVDPGETSSEGLITPESGTETDSNHITRGDA